MNKNLVMIVAFVTLILGAIFLLGPTKARKTEFITVDSSMQGGKVVFTRYGTRPAIPEVKIRDEAGNSLTLNDLIRKNKGQSLLVNFWATWCFPCREEMPELDALQGARGNDDFRVVIISVDSGGLEPSRQFLDKIGIKNLDLYYDEKGILARGMKSIGYPSTILITGKGEQFGILTGPAHWNSASAHALIDRLIADK